MESNPARAAGEPLRPARVLPGGAEEVADRLARARLGPRLAAQAEDRHAFLARASMALGASLDSGSILRAVVDLAVPRLAEFCWVDVLDEGGAARRAACAHADPVRASLLTPLLGTVRPDPSSPAEQARRTGKPQLGPIAPPYRASAADSRESDVLAELSPRLLLVLPLASHGQVLALLSLFADERHRYAAEEFTTATEFARRAASALEHALLYESALGSRAMALRAQERYRQLLKGLRESQDKYRTLFESSRDAIYITRRDGRFIDVNPAMVEIFGYDREELLASDSVLLFANPQDRERFRTAAEAGSARDIEVRLRTRSGAHVDCLISAMVQRSPAGEIVGYQGIIHDITGRKAAEERLRASEHFTRTIISSVRQGIIVYDRQLRLQVWNRFMEELTGLTAADVLGRPAHEVLPHLRQQKVEEVLARALEGATVHAPDAFLEVPQTGRSAWISTVYSPHVGPGGEVIGVTSIMLDITERKGAEDQLLHNAFHDTLTGLPNRALFVDRLERLLTHAERHPDYLFGVAFLDLDRFKVVNDSLGHVVGDELLVAMARRLELCLRQGDTVARLGGDEFAILLDDVEHVSDATRVAERVLCELGTPFRLTGHEVFTNASIGIALSTTGYSRPEDILRDADTAMYRAKLDGRARYEVFDRNMHEQAVERLQLETDLRRALERHEFELHYQPIVELGGGRISSFEALIRWNHPRRGRVAPDAFIPLAEETGLIVPIGWWVLEEACRQLHAWNARFAEQGPFSVCVNLATKQFVQPDLVDHVDRILASIGLDAHLLKLEITESAVIENEEKVVSTLAALRARGIQLCIDDFGTGYSSLSYLHAFPVDTLKIDRSFVGQIGRADANPRLVETIIALSRNLGMDAVAEGVETIEQLEFLREVGPRYAQGFLFSPALPPDELETMLVRRPVW